MNSQGPLSFSAARAVWPSSPWDLDLDCVRRNISESTVRRLSFYLRILEKVGIPDVDTMSSEELAERTGTTAAQVRTDLSLFGSFGQRGLGYAVPQLASELREILGLDRPWRVALVGGGRIGSALFEYGGFWQLSRKLARLVHVHVSGAGCWWNCFSDW